MENQKKLFELILKIVKQNQIVNEGIKRLLNVETGRLSNLDIYIRELEKEISDEDEVRPIIFPKL
ncbi:hypothetical protein [Chryseobacterium potabilaquae]|uniref:Uncharacterized protein n=1 Tax=Chryseobacterium potabilaquae TaxID=2675057 RepID=A0A6N4X891_9FLAO|nr:hypothetical protein [Chryseobacterium potabilaquae]CAA7197231.1 hypothetical protein CHRY9293_03284 [Chryseobacterium potabilaquae]